MTALVTDPVAFATGAAETQRREERRMIRYARVALLRHPAKGWQDQLVDHAVTLMKARFRVEAGTKTAQVAHAEVTAFEKDLRSVLQHQTTPERQDWEAASARLAASVVTAAISAGTAAAAEHDEDPDSLEKVWFSMEDERVRPSHAEANGQSVGVGEKFTVGGHEMDRPGDLTAPIEEWINCRCVMGLVRDEAAVAAAGTIDGITDGGTDMTITLANAVPDTELPEDEKVAVAEEVPWYGVLAPEDVMSGDGRKFSAGALRARDLPLPLSWQKTNEPGHDGSVVVGRIDEVWRKDGEMRGRGVFLSSVPETDEAIGLLAEGGIRGVSIDADDGTMELYVKDGRTLDEAMEALDEDEGVDLNDIVSVFTDARICGATLCPIPAFMEAFVSLGVPPDEFLDGEGGDDEQEELAASAFVSEKPWDGSASRFTPEQWYASCCLHRSSDKTNKSDHSLPIKEPGGALSRAGVHAAAGRVNQVDATPEQKNAAKAKLRSAYSTLGEDPPDSIKATADTLVMATPKDVIEAARTHARDIALVKTEDGPGWLTHPVDTDRLRDYWAHGEGAVKIGWGTPGDFNRCRSHLAKYVKTQYLSGYCANRHYDALGFWPGQHHAGSTLVASADTAAIRFVHTDDRPKPPADWFDDPHLIEPSPITVTEEGRVYGHLARWDECHIGISGICTVAPHSMSDYAYFRTGYVLTEDGPVPTGTLTLGTGHADKYASPSATVEHYDNTGFGAAYVAAGEDDHGIWVAGCVAPGVTAEQIVTMRASALSGDWREIAGNLELVAALHVNVQGFPIPHPSLAASGGRQVSLVAAGIIPPVVVVDRTELTIEQITDRVLTEMETRATRERMHALALATGRDPASRIKAVAASVRG